MRYDKDRTGNRKIRQGDTQTHRKKYNLKPPNKNEEEGRDHKPQEVKGVLRGIHRQRKVISQASMYFFQARKVS
jgi:hypothetical protein